MRKLFGLLRRYSGSTVVRNAGLMYMVQVSNFAFPLITVPYLAKVLSVERFGLLTFSQTFIWYFYTLTEYGFDLTATRQVAIHRNDPPALSHIFSSTMAAKALLTVLGFVIMMTVVLCTPRLRENWPLFLISFMTVMGGLLFPMWLYQGMEKMGVAAARDFAAKLVATVLTFTVVRHDSDYLWVAVFQSGAMAVAGLVSLLAAPRMCKVRFQFPSWPDVRDAFRDGWSVFLSMAALTLMSSTNLTILEFVATKKDVGYFSAANRLIVAFRGLVGPIVTVVYPRISHIVSRSREDAISFLRRYAILMAAPFLAGSVALFVGAPLVVRLLYSGEKYQPTILLLRILAFSPFLLALSHVYATYFILAFGYSKQWSKIIVQETVLNYVLIGLFLLVFKPTVAIAAAATALDIVALALPYYFYRKTVGTLMTPATVG